MKAALNIVITLAFIIAAVVYIKYDRETQQNETATISQPAKTDDAQAAPATKEVQVQHPFQSKQLPPDISKAIKKKESSNPDDLPPDLRSQLNAPRPPLPEDLKRQLELPPQELPPDLQAQLTGPPPPLPDDIKNALQVPPREVSIEEVNGIPEGDDDL